MKTEPTRLACLLHKAVVAQGVPCGVLLHVVNRREGIARRGLVEPGRVREQRNPQLGMPVVQRLQKPLREPAILVRSHIERGRVGFVPAQSLAGDQVGAKPQAEWVIAVAIRRFLVDGDSQDCVLEATRSDSAFLQEHRAVLPVKAAESVLFQAFRVGPVPVQLVPGQAIAAGNDQKHAGQIPIELAHRLFSEMLLNDTLGAFAERFERVEEYHAPAALPIAGRQLLVEILTESFGQQRVDLLGVHLAQPQVVVVARRGQQSLHQFGIPEFRGGRSARPLPQPHEHVAAGDAVQDSLSPLGKQVPGRARPCRCAEAAVCRLPPA